MRLCVIENTNSYLNVDQTGSRVSYVSLVLFKDGKSFIRYTVSEWYKKWESRQKCRK